MFEIIAVNLHWYCCCFVFNLITDSSRILKEKIEFLGNFNYRLFIIILYYQALVKNSYFVFYKVPNTYLTFEK